jgi:flagellar motor protein MotB
MAGLLVIFILACAILLLQLIELRENTIAAQKDLMKANQVRVALLDEIADRLREQGIEVEVSDNHTVIRIPEDQLFFRTGRYAIQKEHVASVHEIGKVLFESITAPERLKYLDTIFIEGHTDSRRAKKFPMGNWGLSAFRAISIWKYWTEETEYGQSLKELRNKDDKPLFSVSGYAASRRLNEDDATADERRKNRRIDIRFTTRQPSIKDFDQVLELLPEDM